MKLNSLVPVMVASVAIFSAGHAAASIVNIDAGSSAGTSLALSAGDHLVSWIGVADGGSYDAWSAWSSGDNWLNAILVTTGSGQTGYGTGVYPWYATPGDALAAAQSLTFHMVLANAETVNFMVADNIFGDNRGGVSLSVTAVPLPAALPLALSGFGLLGFAASRRKNATV